VKGQVDDLLEEIRLPRGEERAVLVTTLTKRMAEDLTKYFSEIGVRAGTCTRKWRRWTGSKILRDLRKGEFDCCGINLLLRGPGPAGGVPGGDSGCDTRKGYLSTTSADPDHGAVRAAHFRKAILYADRRTKSMNEAIGETYRRRAKQMEYNKENNITRNRL